MLTTGQQIPVYFNNTPQGSVPATPEELDVGKYMRGAFAAFAKNTTSGLLSYGGEGDGWPRYSPQDETLVRLAYENRVGANLAQGVYYDDGC